MKTKEIKAMLDEKSPVSLQYQLKVILTSKIKNNEWSVGTLIPSERELCEIYGVSRITVRQALKDIENDGYLTRKQGKGTYVSSPKLEQRLNKFYSFSEEVKKMGLEPSAVVVGLEVISCGKEIGSCLEIEEEANVYKVSRLRLAGDEIYAYEISYIPYSLTDKLTADEIQGKGLYNTIEKYSGVFPDETTEVFEAVSASPEIAGYLKIKKNSAVLRMERFAKAQEKCVEYCISSIRGDKYRYKVMLK